jgi:hypothetical protein
MKTLRTVTAVALFSLSTAAFAQAAPAATPLSAAQTSFEQLKALEGTWEGAVTATPPQPEIQGKIATLSLRVTSRGNALMHDVRMTGIPDNPITMFYLDEEKLRLTHYCDAGNRPRMEAKASADGKTVEFEFLDLAGGTHYGHMHNAVITLIDADHHVEEWTYMLPGDKPVRARFDLRRVK